MTVPFAPATSNGGLRKLNSDVPSDLVTVYRGRSVPVKILTVENGGAFDTASLLWHHHRSSCAPCLDAQRPQSKTFHVRSSPKHYIAFGGALEYKKNFVVERTLALNNLRAVKVGGSYVVLSII